MARKTDGTQVINLSVYMTSFRPRVGIEIIAGGKKVIHMRRRKMKGSKEQ